MIRVLSLWNSHLSSYRQSSPSHPFPKAPPRASSRAQSARPTARRRLRRAGRPGRAPLFVVQAPPRLLCRPNRSTPVTPRESRLNGSTDWLGVARTKFCASANDSDDRFLPDLDLRRSSISSSLRPAQTQQLPFRTFSPSQAPRADQPQPRPVKSHPARPGGTRRTNRLGCSGGKSAPRSHPLQTTRGGTCGKSRERPWNPWMMSLKGTHRLRVRRCLYRKH
mmetsp:Transcript_3640/g.13443  ORF Transcript_3640/g.13443 Transcript_3640/m.13443 type:complete len:222 (+) Transcript_3640:362-1027(+)